MPDQQKIDTTPAQQTTSDEQSLKYQCSETKDPNDSSVNSGVRKWVALISVGGTLVMFGTLGYFTYVSGDPSRLWMRKIVVDHPSGTIGLPICAVIASCIVLLFSATSGPINFEVPGVKLQGGSGPAIVWVITFLSIVYGMKLLWNVAP